MRVRYVLMYDSGVFFFNDTATTEIYTLSLHDALPIWLLPRPCAPSGEERLRPVPCRLPSPARSPTRNRSEEHTSELQSRQYLVCRLLLEKKNIHSTSLLFDMYRDSHFISSRSSCPSSL